MFSVWVSSFTVIFNTSALGELKERCRFSYADALLSAWHIPPSLQPPRQRAKRSSKSCVVPSALCGCPGHSLQFMSRHLPCSPAREAVHVLAWIALVLPCNWCSHVPATAPAQPKQGARGNSESLLCSPQEIVAWGKQVLAVFCL